MSLTIAEKDGEFDLTEDQNRKNEFYADGRKTEKSKDPNNQPFAAKWRNRSWWRGRKAPSVTRSSARSRSHSVLASCMKRFNLRGGTKCAKSHYDTFTTQLEPRRHQTQASKRAVI
jgi:hypothetical protein